MILSTYRLERPLATGGMGSLWVATHAGTGAQVAVKFMDTAQADPTARARFQREAQSLATIHNPHVVTVREYGVEGEMPFIVMDLLEGEDLGARLRRVGRLSLADASRLLTQIGRGLRAAHAAGIVHRDLKPANVFLAASDGEETVKILDFGLAKNATARAVGEGTKTGDLVGSPHFMSPEQIRSPTSIDHRSDLWSLAVIMFRVLTGELPFKGKQVGPVLAQVLTDTIPKATQVAPDLPPALDPFFARGLARDPAQRFQSAQEMAHDLARIAASAGHTEPSARWADPSTSGVTYTSGVTSISGPLLGDSMASAAPAAAASESQPGLRSGAVPGGAAPGTPQASWSGQYALPSFPSASGSGQQAMTPMPPGSFSGQPIPPLATTAAPAPPKPTPWLPWVIVAGAAGHRALDGRARGQPWSRLPRGREERRARRAQRLRHPERLPRAAPCRPCPAAGRRRVRRTGPSRPLRRPPHRLLRACDRRSGRSAAPSAQGARSHRRALDPARGGAEGAQLGLLIAGRFYGGRSSALPWPRMRAAIAVWAMLVVGLSAARPALAAPPDEGQRKKIARELADLAYGQYTSGDYAGAIESFKRADATYHAPTLVVGLARAQAKAHHLLAARASFEKVIAEDLPPGSPDAFLGAQKSARDEVKALAATIPTLEVRLQGNVPAAGVTVTIDDGPATLGAPAEIDPGKHQVTVAHDGARETRSVVVAEGAHQSIDFDLAAHQASAVPGVIALSVGGAGLVMGAIAGVVTLKQASDIKSRCPAGVCPVDEKPSVSSANAVAAVSTAGFVLAGAGAVVGTVLLVRRPQTAGPAVTAVIVGPGSLMLRGSF